MYVALRPLDPSTGPTGKTTHRYQPGDVVPDATSWPNLRAYVNTRQLEWRPAAGIELRELVEALPPKELGAWLARHGATVEKGADRSALVGAALQLLDTKLSPPKV